MFISQREFYNIPIEKLLVEEMNEFDKSTIKNEPECVVKNEKHDGNDVISKCCESSSSIQSDLLLHKDGPRKSAFQPYRQIASCTPLTNLQRGNTQAEAISISPTVINIYTLAGRGELNEEDLKCERSINLPDEGGFTPLHWAAAFGQYSSVKLLLEHGADVNRLTEDEESALHLAANGGHHEVIKLLIQNGADVNQNDHMSNTALMYAAKGNFPHSCNELLLGGANLSLTNLNDETAYTIAMKNSCNLAQTVIQKHIITKFDI